MLKILIVEYSLYLISVSEVPPRASQSHWVWFQSHSVWSAALLSWFHWQRVWKPCLKQEIESQRKLEKVTSVKSISLIRKCRNNLIQVEVQYSKSLKIVVSALGDWNCPSNVWGGYNYQLLYSLGPEHWTVWSPIVIVMFLLILLPVLKSVFEVLNVLENFMGGEKCHILIFTKGGVA